MNGIEHITARILQDARAEADAVSAQAAEKAKQIAAEAEAKAGAEREAILAAGRADAQQRRQRLGSVAQLEARKLVLDAKQQMVTAAFDGALDRLCALEGDAAVELLAKLAAAASATGREQMLLAEKDRAAIGTKAVHRANELLGTGNLTLAEEAAPIRGGLILRDGPVETNCSFETLVQLRRSELAAPVAKLLFG